MIYVAHESFSRLFYRNYSNLQLLNVLQTSDESCERSEDLWPQRKTQIIISSLIPKICSFPATPTLEKDNIYLNSTHVDTTNVYFTVRNAGSVDDCDTDLVCDDL